MKKSSNDQAESDAGAWTSQNNNRDSGPVPAGGDPSGPPAQQGNTEEFGAMVDAVSADGDFRFQEVSGTLLPVRPGH